MLLEPEFEKQGYDYYDKEGNWCIKEDAPDWAKEEFKEYKKKVNPEPDENGIVTQY